MGLTESLNDYVLESNNPALQPDHLYRCARLWGRCFWGEQYPDQEVLDDIENYRALELLHNGFCLRHRTWKVLVDGAATETSESLMCDIMSIRDVRAFCYPLLYSITDNSRNTLIFLSPRNLPVVTPPDARSTQYTWPSAPFMLKFYSTDDYCVWRVHLRSFTGRPQPASSIFLESKWGPTPDYCDVCNGHC